MKINAIIRNDKVAFVFVILMSCVFLGIASFIPPDKGGPNIQYGITSEQAEKELRGIHLMRDILNAYEATVTNNIIKK